MVKKAMALAFLLPLAARCGLVIDGVPQWPLSGGAYLTVSNFVAGNYYAKQAGTTIGPGVVTLWQNLNETSTFSFDGVTLWRTYQDPHWLIFSWPEKSGRLVTEESYGYPVFRLELGENWTDFEIKASTNNYDVSGNASGSNLVYYYRSWTVDQHPVNPDTNAWAYFTDDCAADARVWRFKGLDSPISANLTSTGSVVSTVYFYPSRGCECGWMRKANTNLVWSWLRVDDLGYEKNFDGTQTRWRAIRPDSWETDRTVP